MSKKFKIGDVVKVVGGVNHRGYCGRVLEIAETPWIEFDTPTGIKSEIFVGGLSRESRKFYEGKSLSDVVGTSGFCGCVWQGHLMLKSDWLALSVDQLPVMREEDAPSNATKWDRRFLAVASVVASWSKDPGTKVGAVIADPAKRRIVSTGYNGVPRNMEDVNLDDRVSKLQRTIHAEMNAILNSCERLDGHTLYVSSLPPCERCAVHIIQAGIKRVVWLDPGVVRDEWNGVKAIEFFTAAGVITVCLPRGK